MKVVLDANVLVAAFAARGLCEAVLEHCLAECDLVVSEPLLREVGEKLETKLRLPEATRNELLQFLQAHTTSVEPASVDPDACRDPDDLMVLGTAAAARASYLVTGDKDLFVLESYGTIPIVSPRKFWESLRVS
jgi:putative PIN family toxin of toxin-antitoxin system